MEFLENVLLKGYIKKVEEDQFRHHLDDLCCLDFSRCSLLMQVEFVTDSARRCQNVFQAKQIKRNLLKRKMELE